MTFPVKVKQIDCFLGLQCGLCEWYRLYHINWIQWPHFRWLKHWFWVDLPFGSSGYATSCIGVGTVPGNRTWHSLSCMNPNPSVCRVFLDILFQLPQRSSGHHVYLWFKRCAGNVIKSFMLLFHPHYFVYFCMLLCLVRIDLPSLPTASVPAWDCSSTLDHNGSWNPTDSCTYWLRSEVAERLFRSPTNVYSIGFESCLPCGSVRYFSVSRIGLCKPGFWRYQLYQCCRCYTWRIAMGCCHWRGCFILDQLADDPGQAIVVGVVNNPATKSVSRIWVVSCARMHFFPTWARLIFVAVCHVRWAPSCSESQMIIVELLRWKRGVKPHLPISPWLVGVVFQPIHSGIQWFS